MLPFGLVDSIEVATPIISVFLSYTPLALEAIAEQIADPFGDIAQRLNLLLAIRALHEDKKLSLAYVRIAFPRLSPDA